MENKKKVIGIYCGILAIPDWDEKSLEKGMGGSETWAACLASAFQKIGYQVMVFAQPSEDHTAEDGVQYIRADKFPEIVKTQEFDYFIISRFLEGLELDIKCENIYLMVHDLDLISQTKLKNFMKVKKVAVLSDFQKSLYQQKYNLTDFFKTTNGINPELYQDVDDSKKKNMMVWSSCPDRCLQYFIQRVFPRIKDQIPDFTLKVCSYVDIENQPKVDGVEFVGHLSKVELANLQKEAKIWTYPNLGYLENPDGSIKVQGFHETFCITAVENAWAGNAIVCYAQGAIPEIFKGYSGIIKTHMFNEMGVLPENNYEISADLLAAQTISLLQNDEDRLKKVAELKELSKEYTWDQTALNWVKEFETPFTKTIPEITISVCLIVKNEEEKIRRCLESLVPFADEICVADTGSTDKTVEICRSIPKVKVQEIGWRNDFAWARNISFSMATSTHIMWVDADDKVEENAQKWILDAKKSGELNYVDIVYMPYVYRSSDGTDYFDFPRDRIYKRDSTWPVWYGRIHEYIMCRKDGHNPINHFLTRETAELSHYHDSPGSRNLNIFIDMEKMGEISSGRDWYYYGKEWFEAGNFAAANFCFQKSLDSKNVFGSDKTNALQLMAKGFRSLGNPDEAFFKALEALGTTSTPRADVCCLLGDAYLQRGSVHWAKVWYREAIDNRLDGLEDTFCERMYYTWYPRLQLGTLLIGEDNEAAQKYFDELHETNPDITTPEIPKE